MSDIRYAIRSLLRARWFTVGALLTFALGIGVNVAVFSAVDRMLFRALPYGNADQLYLMRQTDRVSGQSYGTLPATWVVDARRNVRGIQDLALGDLFSSSFSPTREPGGPSLALTSATFNILSVTGVTPALGRGFVEADALEKRAVVMLAYEAWQRQFDGRADILQVALWQANRAFEIVGVLPKGLIPPGSTLTARWHGIVLDDELMQTATPKDRSSPAIVWLAPGQTRELVEAALVPIVDEWQRQQPPPPPGQAPYHLAATLAPLGDVMFAYYRPYLWLVSVAAALVLLMVCANLASLLIVRGRSRERHAAIQVSLGASPVRLIRAALAESALLSLVGGLVGLVGLAASSQALRAVLPPIFSGYAASLTDVRVAVFALSAATFCAICAGLAPALRATRTDVLSVLQRTGGGARPGRLRGGASLLVIEAAIGVALVTGAAMTTRNLVGLLRTDVGYEPDGLYNVNITFPSDPKQDSATRLALYNRAFEVLQRLPGVQLAGGADIATPVSGARVRAFGKGYDRSGMRWNVTAGFVEAMGMRVVAGRTLTSAEVNSQADVAVLSELGIGLVWPGAKPAEAVGRLVRFEDEAPKQVVGVVSDVLGAYAGKPDPSIYVPVSPAGFRQLVFVVRANPGATLAPAMLRTRVQAEIATPQSVGISAQATVLHNTLRDDRFRTALFGAFGVVGLLLAAVGLYAVASFEANLRRLEMGVRLAMGATPAQLKGLIVRDAIRPVAIGIAIGLAASYWAGKFLQTFLHGVDARDPWTFGIVGLTLVLVTLVAAWLPAHRASQTDPASVLRAQ